MMRRQNKECYKLQKEQRIEVALQKERRGEEWGRTKAAVMKKTGGGGCKRTQKERKKLGLKGAKRRKRKHELKAIEKKRQTWSRHNVQTENCLRKAVKKSEHKRGQEGPLGLDFLKWGLGNKDRKK